jgi:hypothetical protein
MSGAAYLFVSGVENADGQKNADDHFKHDWFRGKPGSQQQNQGATGGQGKLGEY